MAFEYLLYIDFSVSGPGKIGGGGYFNYRSGTTVLLFSKELFLYMCLIQLYSCVSVHS